ncbi:sigma-70 family RNA polymerase sigma factor [Blastopirellula sp. JC732]|uniref:Sigma-70 family RNA polymerase sigma factor n=1 Tax=Blastopirellula sediminis TaxID=2894196 RepID=A0A9X1MJI4_9BACT|nr:sigma-70 family RNA polymerase sigma factor [Blastopirellula sediminis]MCC9608125.1 sigma-70 family RNA polymerase sigma factor [Blastopirellula sediminis]MCC9627082.1 sigma-70 family RNA polymerase sigma factor [Blastopirellula sediminis]
MESTSATERQIDEILATASQRPAVAYEMVLARSLVRLQGLTKSMMQAYPQLARWEQTDDVFQEASIRLYRSLKAVKPQSARHFFNLANLQIRRTLIDLARKHLGPLSMAANHASNFALDELPDQGDIDAPVTLAQWAEFHEAVDKLPDELGETFSLIWYSDVTHVEAAKLLGVSQKTVQRRYLHARVLLADLAPDLFLSSES